MNKVAVYGGLGNQMFQYAFYMALNAVGKKTRLSLSHYLHYWFRDFELTKAFEIKLPLRTRLMAFFLANAKFVFKQKLVRAFLRRVINYQEKKQLVYIEKKEFVFNAAVFNEQQVLFTGTWQAQQYFATITEQVRNEFVFKQPADAVNKLLVTQIKNCNAVSMHIRRADYLNKEWEHSLHVIKDASYYNNAAEYITNKIPNACFFIFSDDMQWVKENIIIPNCTYVENNKGANNFYDMYLMSLCRHNIIANSTFSWWAAWLNTSQDKIVIMPEKWMNNNLCEGIFPEAWIKLKV